MQLLAVFPKINALILTRPFSLSDRISFNLAIVAGSTLVLFLFPLAFRLGAVGVEGAEASGELS